MFAVRSFDGLLVAMGIASAFCLMFPVLALVAAITIIGIPIALAMAVIPAAFTFLLIARLAKGVLPTPFAWIGGVTVAALVVSLPPMAINRTLQAKATALAAGDLDTLGERPLAVRSLAVRQPGGGWSRDEARCDEFCLRALLGGSLDRVLVADVKDPAAPLDLAERVLSFRMERRSACPEIKLGRNGDLNLDRATRHQERGPAPDELMRLQIATGNCLIQSDAALGDAEAIVTMGRYAKGANPYAAGLDPFADTVTADRFSVLLRGPAGFEERYRWTGVVTYMHLPALLPSYVPGYGFEARAGFHRTAERINIDDKHYERPDRAAFYTKTLGYDLTLDASDAAAVRTAVLERALESGGALDPVASDIARDFFTELRMRNAVRGDKAVRLDEAALAMRILADRRINVPDDVFALVHYSQGLPSATVSDIGGLLFARLMEIRLDGEPSRRNRLDEAAARLGSAIAMLPAAALADHRDEMETLARRADLRAPAWQALTRLSDFGASATPTLLFLIDDANRFKIDGNYGKEWQHPYLAGLIGLCKLGPAGAAAIAPLLERIDAGAIPLHGSYRNLTIRTLVSMGADVEQVWRRIEPTLKDKETRAFFDREVRRARDKADCTF